MVHFFCRAETGARTLSDFIGNWKKLDQSRDQRLEQAAVSARGGNISLSRIQNHPLDMRVNVERRRAQKTYQRLVAVARELDCKT
jgi:hypothetical protein